MKDFIALILAGGLGVRMRSDITKVLHPICGRPMIDFVLDAVISNKPEKTFVIAGEHNKKQLVDYFKFTKRNSVDVILQKKPLGTADAVKSTKARLKGLRGQVLIVCADTPLIRANTLRIIFEHHLQTEADCTILTTFLDNATGMGRVVRDEFSKIKEIIEESDATEFQKRIKEVNSGVYCFKINELLTTIDRIEKNEKKKEYYLTDIVHIFYEQKKKIESFICDDTTECLGVNSQSDLTKANSIMRQRIIEHFLNEGVFIVDPQSTFIDWDVKIGKNTKILPFSIIESGVKIGENCSIGPFCHLRPGTTIDDESCIGNFTELVRSFIGSQSRCKHFSYLGDTYVGKKVNIGAGVVVANYDGKNKNPTTIRDGAFIGCDSVLIAPVKIGKKVVTGAGSVITKNSSIKDGEVVVGVPARSLKELKKEKQVNSKKSK